MKKILTAAVMAVSASAAFAEYPEKPVSFVVPWPPGDLEDVLTRLIADEFQEMYGVPAAVVNKPGGGGGPFPGAVEVATAPGDGYTVGFSVPEHLWSPSGHEDDCAGIAVRSLPAEPKCALHPPDIILVGGA